MVRANILDYKNNAIIFNEIKDVHQHQLVSIVVERRGQVRQVSYVWEGAKLIVKLDNISLYGYSTMFMYLVGDDGKVTKESIVVDNMNEINTGKYNITNGHYSLNFQANKRAYSTQTGDIVISNVHRDGNTVLITVEKNAAQYIDSSKDVVVLKNDKSNLLEYRQFDFIDNNIVFQISDITNLSVAGDEWYVQLQKNDRLYHFYYPQPKNEVTGNRHELLQMFPNKVLLAGYSKGRNHLWLKYVTPAKYISLREKAVSPRYIYSNDNCLIVNVNIKNAEFYVGKEKLSTVEKNGDEYSLDLSNIQNVNLPLTIKGQAETYKLLSPGESIVVVQFNKQLKDSHIINYKGFLYYSDKSKRNANLGYLYKKHKQITRVLVNSNDNTIKLFYDGISSDEDDLMSMRLINRRTLESIKLSFENHPNYVEILVNQISGLRDINKNGVNHQDYDLVGYDSFGEGFLYQVSKDFQNRFGYFNQLIDKRYLFKPFTTMIHTISFSSDDRYYQENYSLIDINPHQIIFESQFGARISDSGYAIFRYLVDHEEYDEFQFLFVIDDENSLAPSALEPKYDKRAKFIVRNSDEYKHALLSSKYLFNSVTFPEWFAKKDQQIYVNTWHGTAIKSLGYDIVGEKSNSRNTVRNLMMTDYIISPQPHMTDIFLNSFKLQGQYEGIILEGGYPRNDLVLSTNKKNIQNKLHEFGIELDPNKETIMYAPTWRGQDFANPVNQVDDLKKLIQNIRRDFGYKYNVLLKVHQAIFKLAQSEKDIANILVPDYIDANEILSVTDVLISDFSSIFFDFLITKRPVVFYIPDKQEYVNERGLYIGLKELPGAVTENYQELKKQLNRIAINHPRILQRSYANEFMGKYNRMLQKYLPKDDGFVTSRVVNRIFKGQKSEALKEIKLINNKIKLLIGTGGMQSNGITSSLLNLLNNIDYTKYDVTVLSYAHAKGSEPVNNIEKINNNVRVMFHFGSPLFNKKQFIMDYRGKQNLLTDSDWTNGLRQGIQKDITRIFPNMNFDYAIDFVGYSYNMLKYELAVPAKSHIVYQHNDLLRDSQKYINGNFVNSIYLGSVFKLYPYVDKLVSVSPVLKEINQNNLKNYVRKDQMFYARNVIQPERIKELAEEKLDLDDMLSIYGNRIKKIQKTGLNFVTSGRLSTEKNQIELIKAFAKFRKEYPKARLFILGKGPLQAEINKTIQQLKQQNYVVMLGHLDNPFAFINRMDYFVLPSLYEGQPMVLLEALTIGKPVMASNILPNIGVLGNSEYGVLAPGTSSDALLEGLFEVIKNQKFKTFNADRYNEQAIEDFYKLLH